MNQLILNRLLFALLLVFTGGIAGVSPAGANTLLSLERVSTKQYEPLDQYIGKGKWIVANFWSPSCSACVRELPTFIELSKQDSEYISVIGITLDHPSFEYGKTDIIKRFLWDQSAEARLDYPLFLADLAMSNQILGRNLVGIPLTALYHPDGRLMARWPGEITAGEVREFITQYKNYLNEVELTDGF